MIAVIADDLTGAAELAGIGKTYGLTVELAIGRHSASVNQQSTADLLVIATDARSVSEAEAVQEMTAVSEMLRTMKPQLIFKKVDSVLRGHVVAETKAQLKVLGLAKALIVPANPALGRILIDGHYYVQGELIHETHFSKDPEFPITESNVLKRLAVNDASLSVQPPTVPSLQSGIVIGEVGTQGDLKAWASRVDEQTLPGGGAGFFTAILSTAYTARCSSVPSFGSCKLFVCGSAFGYSVDLVKKAAMTGNFVCYMPKALMQSDDQEPVELANWVAQIVSCFQRNEQVIMAVPAESVVDSCKPAVCLRTLMAKAVKQVLDQVSVDELIIEGGSTASAVLREIDVTRLAVAQELAAGAVRSRALEKPELHITVKPGSYQWPTDLWTF
ncbi:four-carbon acid sugar kinase family protein [Spirosoma daeguense]